MRDWWHRVFRNASVRALVWVGYCACWSVALYFTDTPWSSPLTPLLLGLLFGPVVWVLVALRHRNGDR